MSSEASLLKRLPESKDAPSDLILDRFLDYVKESRLELYPAQEEALLELYGEKNVILNTPTGSGKSLVAAGLHFLSLARGTRSVYTCPIKALVNEKFLALCREFGPEQVGMITGDASVNPNALIICCTAEILALDALRYGDQAPIADVIMDEFHYFSDRERGVAWQIPLLAMPQARFLLMSATLGDTTPFEEGLTRLTKRETVLVRTAARPVPLEFEYSENALHETIPRLIRENRAPIYLVNFTQRDAAEEAQNFLSIDFCTKDEKKAISAALEGFKFSSPYGKEIQKLLRHGIGLHHAGLLPRYRVMVERLAQKGLLKIISGTDTLGVGVNVPIRTVLFTKLCKFDGEKTTILSVRDFQQISGRAGRKGFDDRGTVVVQAPEHVIENLRQEQKAAGDAKKMKKLVKRKPPEKGYLPWTKETFLKLVNGQPEALASRFRVTHAMLLNVLARPHEDGCRVMRKLIRDSYESDHAKRQHGKTAFQLFRSLVERKIIEFKPLRVNVNLQEDFSLNHALSLYLIDTIALLDPTLPDYALSLLTLVESILENPDLVLRKQLDRLKSERMQELKMQGMDFDERVAELEKMEYPKPNREFIYDTFNAFSAAHPWVGQENIRPKSIAREMYENFQSFPEYIRDYELQRAEGLLLRYLSEVYKAMMQNVPDQAKSEEVFAMIVYFGTMVRSVDSSLLDEWEKMRNPNWVAAETSADAAGGKPEGPPDVTRDKRGFTVLVRNEVFRFVRALSRGDMEEALGLLERPPAGPAGREGEAGEILGVWTADSLMKRLEDYRNAGHSRITTDPKARAALHTRIDSNVPPGSTGAAWKVQQILVDPEEHNDWGLNFEVSLERSREAGMPVLTLIDFAAL